MYSVQLTPAGLHPTLRLRGNFSKSTTCSLYALVSLPAPLIADRFQLDQLYSQDRLGSSSTSSTSPPTLLVSGDSARDLESPESRAGPTSVLLRIAGGEHGGEQGESKGYFDVELPLHARYLVPVEQRWGNDGARADSKSVRMEWPAVFYACGLGESCMSCHAHKEPLPFN